MSEARPPFSPWRAAAPIALCIALLLGGTTSACSPFSDTPPIPDSTFAQVLVELHTLAARQEVSDGLPPGTRDSIFARYGVTRADVDATLAHYSHHPEALESIYASVVDTLRAVERRANFSEPSLRTLPDR